MKRKRVKEVGLLTSDIRLKEVTQSLEVRSLKSEVLPIVIF